jgi:predicted MFS family arabinose efflux permease
MNLATIHPWRLAFGGLLAMGTAMGIGRFVYTPILPFMTEAIPLTAAQAGLIASANFAGYLVGALLAATPWLSGSRRFWLMTGMAGSAATTVLTGAGSSFVYLTLVRFLAGGASAFVLVFASSVILERLAAAGAARLSSLHFAGVGAGIAASALLVSMMAAWGLDWQAQWFAAGALAIVTLPVVAVLIPPEPVAEVHAAGTDGFVLTPRLAALIAAYGLFGFGYVITATFLVAIVRGSAEIRHLEPVIWVLFGLGAVPSVALWAALGRRFGVFTAFAAACLVEAVGVLASVLAVNTLGVVLAAACLGGTFVGITALGLVGARTLSPSDPRRILALMTVAFGVGQIVGPVLGGTLFDLTGSFTLPSILAAAALVVAAGLAGILDRPRTGALGSVGLNAGRSAPPDRPQSR